MARYEQTYGSLTQKEPVLPSPQPTPTPTTVMVEPPLAALVRTAVTTVLSKSALRLIPTLVKLQRANGTAILEMTGDGSKGGVQTLLHAAAVVLQRCQNERLCAAGMLSKMGDGSSDRKTTEQVTTTHGGSRGCTRGLPHRDGLGTRQLPPAAKSRPGRPLPGSSTHLLMGMILIHDCI